jgi:hypothetical protein
MMAMVQPEKEDTAPLPSQRLLEDELPLGQRNRSTLLLRQRDWGKLFLLINQARVDATEGNPASADNP